MFPNPQDALPLPPRPSLERYKKLAKELVKACKSGDSDAVGAWAEQWVSRLTKLAERKSKRLQRTVRQAIAVEDFAQRKLLGSKRGSRKCALADAQFVIACSHGFESWPKFAGYLAARASKSSSVSKFEAAADAIVTGDLRTLKRLLR